MLKKLNSKKDARLYFGFLDKTGLNMELGELKTWLIKEGYIEHVEGDRYRELKRMDRLALIKELKELKGGSSEKK